MNRYTFWIPIDGVGDTAAAAWDAAVENLQAGIAQGELDVPPADIFEKGEPVPAAEILGGSLSAGFGINEGEEE